jgi:molybdopterin synthase sulfur carrier subunit
MPTLFIPSPIRDLTEGKVSVVVSASSVREAIESLETQYPGVRDRLCEGDKIRANISVMVDGQISHLKMREKLSEGSEVHFVIAISGGQKSASG